MRAWQGAFFGVAITSAIILACTTDYQKGVDDPLYGGPNALSNTKAPSPFGQAGAAGDGSTPGALACGTAVEAGACTVSWATDILPTLTAACLGSGCHGTTDPIITPDAKATYDVFLKFANGTATASKFLINPCATDETKAYLACNLQGTTGCGVKMPISGTYDPANITKITTWLKCGSPNN